MKEPKTIKVTFRINPKLYDEVIKTGIEATGLDRSEVIRGIIADYARFIRENGI
jgi:hypothetical protein